MMVSIGWQQVGGLTSMLLKSGDIVKNSEKAVSKSMQSYGYQREGFLQRSIAGAQGGEPQGLGGDPGFCAIMP